MELCHASSPIEHQVDNLCKIIIKKTAEFWEERNKAILDLTALISQYEGEDPERIYEIFNINVFRSFVEPIKLMILDLRSQQVRDTCAFLTRLSIITKDLMRHFLRESFESIYTASKVPNKVMSGYVDDCIISLIRHTTFKSSIQLITTESKESRSKGVRERCMGFLNEMLLCWDISDKEADMFQEAIRSGLSDASVRGRELARLSYLNFRELFPKKAEKLKSELQNLGLKTRLEKEEEIHDQEKAAMLLSEADGGEGTSSPGKSHAHAHTQQHQNHTHAKKTSHEQVTNHKVIQHHSSSTLGSNDAAAAEAEDADAILLESAAIVPQNAHLLRRQTHNDDAISSIQALIRGNLVRRKSSRYAFLDSYDESASKNPQPQSPHSPEESHSHLPNHILLSPVGEEHDRRLSSLSDSSQVNSPEKPITGSPNSNEQHRSAVAPRSSSRGGGGSGWIDETSSHHTTSDISPSHIKIGMTAVVIGKDPEVRGTVQYVGQTTFASGYWVGLRLETPTGKNDGSVQGTQYFECPPLHGLFVRPVQLQILDDEEGDEDHEEGGDGEEDFSQQNGLNVKEREREQFEKKSTGDEYVLRTNADTLRETLNAAYALKVKLAKSMSLLNRQLETIEVLEEKVESVPGVVDDDCVEFMSAIVELLHEEEKLIAEFKTYLPNVTKEN